MALSLRPFPRLALPGAASALALLLACNHMSPPPSVPAPVPPSLWVEAFDAYPGASELCWQSVSGPGLHILWWAWTTPDPPEQVSAWYQARVPTAAVSGDKVLEIRADKGRILSVYPVGGAYPSCDKAPGPEVRTVIVVSRGG